MHRTLIRWSTINPSDEVTGQFEFLTAHAIGALVVSLIHVAVISNDAPKVLDSLTVPGVRRSDEVIVCGIDGLQNRTP